MSEQYARRSRRKIVAALTLLNALVVSVLYFMAPEGLMKFILVFVVFYWLSYGMFFAVVRRQIRHSGTRRKAGFFDLYTMLTIVCCSAGCTMALYLFVTTLEIFFLGGLSLFAGLIASAMQIRMKYVTK
ncbi:hypothetical protein [Paenibacillus sp. y28]|uniref:hypothetical protein n=1 Tax=Paenibacillus sp. y28 TaxID=3129110 RepID=UPI003017BA9C